MRFVKYIIGSSLLTASSVFAQPVTGVTLADSGDTAWILIATILIFLMAVPGIMLLCAAGIKERNLGTIVGQALVMVAVTVLLWLIGGYSLVFADGTTLLGGTGNLMLASLAEIRADTTIPESSFALYQLMPAILAPLLLLGSAAERAPLAWLAAFTLLWGLCVYVPLAHWLWSDGWLAGLGAHDYSGGLVIFGAAGISALVIALLIKPRLELPTIRSGSNAALGLIGSGLMIIGWFGLTGGAALAASDDAAAALLNLLAAGSAAVLSVVIYAQIRRRKLVGMRLIQAMLAGFATITACAGYVGLPGAMLLGAIGGMLAHTLTPLLMTRFKIDDALNSFATFGINGLLGALLFPLLVSPAVGGPGYADGATLGVLELAQLIAVGTTVLWSAIVSAILALGLMVLLPMRITEQEERAH